MEVLDPNKPLTKRATRTVRLLPSPSERLNASHPQCQNADYYVRDFPSECVIERKGHIDELATNLFNPTRRKRFLAELRYLRDRCSHPVLLVIGNPRLYLSPTRRTKKPGIVIDALIDALRAHRIDLLLLPNEGLTAREAIGEWAARLLIRGAINAAD